MCQHLEDLDKSVSISQMINDAISIRSTQVQDRQVDFNKIFRKVHWYSFRVHFATNL